MAKVRPYLMNMCLEQLIIMRLELHISMTNTHDHVFRTTHKYEFYLWLCVQNNTWLIFKLMLMHVKVYIVLIIMRLEVNMIMLLWLRYAFTSTHSYVFYS